jgi:hypothetical protein
VKGVSLLFLALLLTSTSVIAEEFPDSPPHVSSLPSPFTKFSADHALAQVFPSYDRKTGRQSEFPDQEGKPALVAILEAKPWNTKAAKYLVVFVEVGPDENTFHLLCGACLTYGLLGVLREDHDRIVLVARQETGPFKKAEHPADGEVGGPSKAIWFSGHSSISLDLAPYKLTRDERLIGVRDEYSHMLMWGANLQLFRVVGRALKLVFEGEVVDRTYHDDGNGPIEKTTAVLSSMPVGRFYDLVVDRTTIRCPTDPENDDLDCTPRHKGMKTVERQWERWTFNGEKFVLKKAPASGKTRPKN